MSVIGINTMVSYRIGKDLNVTNTYLALKKRGSFANHLPANLVLRPGFMVKKCLGSASVSLVKYIKI